jgi:hypothetical protein
MTDTPEPVKPPVIFNLHLAETEKHMRVEITGRITLEQMDAILEILNG